MHVLWAIPPVALIAGLVALAVQLRRVTAQSRSLQVAGRVLDADRAELARISEAAARVRASLDSLEHR